MNATQSKQQKREHLLEGAKSGSQILKVFKDLQDLADDLDSKVEAKLEANEHAYFAAYTNHMLNVRKEYKDLKQKADQEATKTRRDAKIQSVEKELEWFMTEALRLDELVKKTKKELDKWKSKAESLEDDRKFLESQIKGAKRRNLSLRSAVEKAQTSAYSAVVDEAMPGVAPSIRAAWARGQEGRDEERSLAMRHPSSDDLVAKGLPKELEEKYQTCVKRLKEQLEHEQRVAARLRTVSHRNFSEPSEFEDFFVECIDIVKGEIAERRQLREDHHRALSCGARRSRSLTPRSAPVVAAMVRVDDFTAVDRRRLMELLMSSEKVLDFCTNRLHIRPASDDTDCGHDCAGYHECGGDRLVV